MTFSALIEKQFKFVLGWSLFVGAAALIIFSIMWTLDIRHSSKDFIVSHVRDIVLADVNSQNTASIDGQINRIISTWSSNQIFGVRADIFLNGKHWAHGGQLQSFGWHSVVDKHNEILPSGDNLYVEIETDLLGPSLRLGIVLFFFISFFGFVFLTLKHLIKKTIKQAINPLEARVQNIKEISENLLDFSNLRLKLEKTDISELVELDKSLNNLIERILTLEKDLCDFHFQEGQIKAAERLAHSLKGAIANFQLTMTASHSISNRDRESLSSVLRQIISVSENVLKARKSATTPTVESKSVIHVGDVLTRLIATKEKEVENSKAKIQFKFLDLTVKAPISHGPRADFEGSIENVLANAIESIAEHGIISVNLKENKNNLVIEINDTGCGISPEIIPNLASEGFTFEKPNGNGLGLFHLKKTIKEMDGYYSIDSLKNKGTNITISIPRYVEENKTTELVLFPGQTLVIIDDDPLIHSVWDMKLESILNEISVIHISTPPEFHNWMSKNKNTSSGSRQYIFDYEFTGYRESGLDLIEQYDLSFESLLVSGISDSPKVFNHANKLKVQTIPKSNFENIHIKWEGFNEIRTQNGF